MSTSTKKRDLKARLHQANEMLSSWKTESDRGAVLIIGAFLEELTSELFLARMLPNDRLRKELLTGFGPLSSGSARIKLGYSLGWIGPETMRDLDTIRRIRNEFAHQAAPLSFEHPKITQWCGGLLSPASTKYRLKPRDRFLASGLFQGLRLSQLIEASAEPTQGKDEETVRLPRLAEGDEELYVVKDPK